MKSIFRINKSFIIEEVSPNFWLVIKNQMVVAIIDLLKYEGVLAFNNGLGIISYIKTAAKLDEIFEKEFSLQLSDEIKDYFDSIILARKMIM